jgi:general secretion pathway protein B
MSYILDALRRAEADRERERGAVPGLHAQPAPDAAATRGTSPRRWLPWAGGGLLLIAGLGAGMWWAGSAREAAAPVATPTPRPAVSAAPPVAPAPDTAAPAVAPPAAVTPPAPAASVSPYLPPAPPPVAVVAPPAPPARATPAAEPARLPLLSELPEATRRELPRLALGGSVYSDDPRSRLVIINGEVLHEGARLAPELVLDQIRPRELVLRYRGQAYRQPL